MVRSAIKTFCQAMLLNSILLKHGRRNSKSTIQIGISHSITILSNVWFKWDSVYVYLLMPYLIIYVIPLIYNSHVCKYKIISLLFAALPLIFRNIKWFLIDLSTVSNMMRNRVMKINSSSRPCINIFYDPVFRWLSFEILTLFRWKN